MRVWFLAVALIAVLGGGGGCGSGEPGSQEILVFAAASLTESFTEIGRAFERSSGIPVRFNFGPSDGLATAIDAGAPADVFASASPRWMDAVAEGEGLDGEAVVFARNRLVVIVPDDNPAGLRAFGDLARPGVKLVLAAAGVPAGGYAREALGKAGLEAAERNVVSGEEDVKGVVQKVLLGEADAGIVYATDLTQTVAAQLGVLAIPDAHNVIASYPIGVIRGSQRLAAARSFVGFVTGPAQSILRAAGFLAP